MAKSRCSNAFSSDFPAADRHDRGELDLATGNFMIASTPLLDDILPAFDAIGRHDYVGNISEPVAAAGIDNSIPSTPTITTPIPVAGEFLVNTPSADGQFVSSVAALDGGGFVVTWMGSDADGYGIFAQRFNASGTKVGAELQVNTYTTNSQQIPMVSALSGGGFVIVWASNDQDGDGSGIYGQRYDAAGSPAGSEFRANATAASSQQDAWVTGLAGGGFVVAWESTKADASGSGIYAQRYDASGAVAGGEFRVNTFTNSFKASPSLVALSGGGFVVTWVSYGQGSPGSIYGQRYDATGGAVGGEFQVNTDINTNKYSPAVASLNNNSFVITWTSNLQDGSNMGVYAQRYDGTGTKVGGEFRANTYITGPQQYASVTGLDDGGFLISWTSAVQDGSGSGVYAQRYSASGVANGSEFLVNQTTSGIQTSHATPRQNLSQLEDGTIVITWQGNGVGDDYGVFARQFSVGAVNQGPVVDLNGAATGIDTTAAYTEDQAAVKLIQSVAVSDDGSTLTGATISFASGFVAGDILRVNGSLSGAINGITYGYNDTTGVLTMTGSASVADYQSLLSTLAYKTYSDNPGTARDITVTVTDGTATSTAAHIALAVTPVNDAPLNSVPGAQSANTGGTITFSTANGNAITVSDPDAGALPLRVKLEAEHGTITLGSMAGVTVSGNGSGFVIISGTISAINNSMNGLTYHGTAGYVGADTFMVSTNDRGSSGLGGQMTDNDGIAITWHAAVQVQEPIGVDKAADSSSHDVAVAFTPSADNILDHGPAIASIGHDLLHGTIFLG